MPQVTITVRIELDEKLAEEIIGMIKEVLYATREAGPPRELLIEISDVGGKIRLRGEDAGGEAGQDPSGG